MATTVLPLLPAHGDDYGEAELARVVAHVPADRYGAWADGIRAAMRATPEPLRHLLVLVDVDHAGHLIEPLVWVGDHLVPRPRPLPAIACRLSRTHPAHPEA